jgi:hypothetical protein
MKFRWQVVAALSILPFGAALADYADLSKAPAPAAAIERTVEHQSLLDVAEQSVEHATQSTRELAIAVENARRAQDMLLVTCLSDALETVRATQADAIANLGRMGATTTVAEARALSANVGEVGKELHAALENAARCKSTAEAEDGETVVSVEVSDDSTLDPGFGPGPGLPGINPPPPVIAPPIIDVMEPGTDMPPVPPTASPMR